MSITNTKAKSVYNANGTTTEWNLGFTYNDTVSNVHIYIVDANDNETEVTNNYSIADGVLTYPTTDSGLEPLAEGNKLVIVRDTPRTQDIELTSNGKLDGKVLEGGYDKLTLQVQELTEQVNRAIKFPVTEDSADNFLDPITAITEAKKEALVEIAQATTPAEVAKDTAVAKAQVATEQATIATNAATSAKAAQVGAEQAEQNATAQAEKAENAVTAFVEGLGTAKNAVIDLGTFDGKIGVTSSRTIEFDKKPIAVSLRFSDTNKKLWINGTNSTVGIEVVDNAHCNLFYSIASADFVGQNAVKGPFAVQAIIQYSVLGNAATETEKGTVQLATKAEAEAGTNDTKAMTPLKTKYAIEANATVQTLRNDIDDLGDQVHEIEAKIPAEASDSNQLADKAFVNDKIAAINFIKWVTELPATGETKYLYAIARTEKDKEGHYIAALYVWDGSAWRGAGGYSLNIDPDTIATKTYVTNITDVLSAEIATNTTDIAKNAGDIAALDADKQDVISDLETIRSGAAKGATALQSVPLATTTVAGIVKPDGKTVKVDNDGKLTATADTSGYLPLTGGTLTGDLTLHGGDLIIDTYKGVSIRLEGGRGAYIQYGSEEGALLLAATKNGAVEITSEKGLYNNKTKKYFIDESKIGAASGVAGLDGNSLVPTANLPIDGSTITVNSDGKLSASGSSAPDNMMTTNTFQEISARKDFNDSVYLNSEVRAKKITMQNGATGLVQTSTGVQVGDYSVPVEIETSSFNINTIHPNNGAARPATLNGKQIATTDDVAKAGGDNGIKGDYCTSYGILEAPNGILTNPSGMQVTLKQGVVIQLAGQDIKTTVSGDMTQTLTSTSDCDLFYVNGTTSLMEVAKIVWSKTEPDNGQTGVLAWWNPDNANKKWKFKSNDTGNVWKEAIAGPVAHIHTNGTAITRIDHIGYRVMDDEVYALKSDLSGSGFDFEGTKAEFDAAVAAGTITDDSVSLITDDVSGDNVATKAELAAVDNSKADTALSNVLANIDYVVESKFPTADDPTWCRVYKSGWIEQGGVFSSTGNLTYTITFLKPFANTKYTALLTSGYSTLTESGIDYVKTKTTTNMIVIMNNVSGFDHNWEAKGMGAN